MARTRRRNGTGRVFEYPPKSGRWWAQLPERDGQTGPRWRVADKVSGERELAQKLADFHAGVRVYDRDDTFGDWICYWVDEVVSVTAKPTTLESYRQVIRLYVLSQPMSHIRLIDLDLPALRRWVAGMAKHVSPRTNQPLSPHTIRNAYARISASLLVAYEDKRISWMPPRTIRLPPINDIEKRALTIEECALLVNHASNPRLALMYQTLITTGVRGSELIGMLWEMIDWDGRQLRLTSHLKWLRESKIWKRLSLKNRKNRTIPLDDLLINELRAHRERQLEERCKAGDQWQENGLIFPTSLGTPFHTDNLLDDIQRNAREAGIGHVTTHELRHTSGSLMLQDGKTMTVVSKILGHSSVSMTEKTYAHGYEADKRDAVASLSRRLQNARKETT